MKLVVVGGHSRNIGKTSLAAGIIAGSTALRWTALKITQFGHGVCSSSGEDCDCAVDDPTHPFAITRERDAGGPSDTSRLLAAGAAESYWVRASVGQFGDAWPALRRLIENRSYVLVESNTILEFARPDLYLSLLQFDCGDFKESCLRWLHRADAFIVAPSKASRPDWDGVDPRVLERRPVFKVPAPGYCTSEVVDFVTARLRASAARDLPALAKT